MDWTNLYQHHTMLTFRVWPCDNRTLEASLKEKLFKIDGMKLTNNDLMAVTHRYAKQQVYYYSWEMSKEDGDKLLCVGAAGARIDEMRVKTPGSMLDTVKKEYWLEVDVTVYPKARERVHCDKSKVLHGKEADVEKAVKEIWEHDHDLVRKWVKRGFSVIGPKYRAWLEEWNNNRREFTGIHYIVNHELIDIDLMARKIMEGKIVLIDWRLHRNNKVQLKHIEKKLEYWFDPAKAPDEPGGEFWGYCLGHSVFWCDEMDIPEEVLAEGAERCKAYRAEAKREKRRREIEKHFIEAVTTRVAKAYGISRERVMRRFIEEGFVDWMAEEAERVANDESRMHLFGIDAQCQGPAAEAAKVLGFCVDSMAIRPPDPPPVIYSLKKQEERLERQRKKIDEFNKLPKEEQERVLAMREHRMRGRPEGLLKRIVIQLSLEDNRIEERDAIMAELTAAGVTELILNAIRTRRERINHPFADEQQEAIVRIGTKAARLLMRCKTAQAVEGWQMGV